MHVFLVLLLSWSFATNAPREIREMQYEGKTYETTYNIEQFNGRYSGSKSGYLQLNEDGTGVYVYDVFGVAPSDCKRGPIELEYGFPVDEKNEPVKMEREYGYSYPIILKSTGETSFQGCRTEVMLDFILEKKDGNLHVSSSDNWIKQ